MLRARHRAGRVAALALLVLAVVPAVASAEAGPVVQGVNLRRGPLAGGSTVQIAGSGLSGATQVRFGASTPATSFSVVSDEIIRAVVPPHPAGLVNVYVDTPAGTNPNQPSSWYQYLAPPTVTAVSPIAGPAAGGNSVTITGSGLRYASRVRFGPGDQGAAAFQVVDDTTITATVPAGGSAKVVNVWVDTPGGTNPNKPSSWYRFVAPPSVTEVSPNRGPTSGGTTVVITGGPFTDVVAVYFGQTCWFAICTPDPASSFTVDTVSQITAVAPPKPAGVGCVKVVTSLGGASLGGFPCWFTYE